MSPTKPTIVIVPGSFSAHGAYDPFLALLRAEGFTAVAVNLPSTQKRMPLPPATLKDDAVLVRGVVGALVAEKALLLLGFDRHQLPIRASLRRFGQLIRAAEEAAAERPADEGAA